MQKQAKKFGKVILEVYADNNFMKAQHSLCIP